MKFKAVLFDMDGLLIDSMYHWLEIDKKFFTEKGVELTPEMVKYFTGRSLKENILWMKEKFGWEDSVETMVYMRKDLTNAIYSDHSQIMPGADDLIRRVAKTNIKQAIASGATEDWINIIVDRFKWREHFDGLISVEHVEHKGKPAPDVYLHAAEKLEINPNDCVVFEDAENGVLSAKAAGMHCVAVPDERWSFGDFSKADLVINSLEDERIDKLLNL
ncbi:MAG: HAD-IA family hydrolase [Candidatus Magasanikbacteria bacterium]|nr:HAD-IA family hydrolase [Candidatus Magasanikbacteria bacterium]